MKKITALWVGVVVGASLGWGAPHAMETDVVIYGSSPAGLAAAITAAEEGAAVLLISEGPYVGGMMAQGGLTSSDIGDGGTVGGVARRFFDRLDQHYTQTYGEKSSQVAISVVNGVRGARFEPHQAERVFEDWLTATPGLTVWRGLGLHAVEKRAGGLVAVRLADSAGNVSEVKSKIFIDASYTGDLLAAAGAAYRVGREARSEFNESLGTSAADEGIMAYNYRVTLTDDPENRRLLTAPPPGYDPKNYAFELARIHAVRPVQLAGSLFRSYWRLPSRKQDSNIGDWPGRNWDYPEASPARRREIELAHRNFSLGYLWLLQHHPGVPEPIRVAAQEWGFPKDEFVDNENFPRQIYVREARRLIGERVMTQHDLTQARFQPDGIALGSYPIDSHRIGGKEKVAAPATKEAGSMFETVKPYEISYRSLVPKKSHVTNLLVPLCMSATHVAWCSIRMESVFMMMGEASGVAAALASKRELAVQDVPVAELRERLRRRGAIINVPPEPLADFAWAAAVPQVGEPVAFSYRASEHAATVAKYYWDFDGDGVIDSEDRAPTRTFKFAKGTVVALVVEDSSGKRSIPRTQLVPVGGVAAGDQELDPDDGLVAPDKGVTTKLTSRANHNRPFYGQTHHHDRNDMKGLVSADYLFPMKTGGRYKLYVSGPGNSRASNMPVTVTTAVGGSSTVRINQNGGNPVFGLVPAGEYEIPPDSAVKVGLSNTATDGYVIFDLVRWVLMERAATP